MYALIACLEDGGEPVLLATARTLKAAQRKFDKALAGDPPGQPRYRFIGFLTPDGLVNYHGNRISKTSIGYVTVKMGLDYD